MIYLFDTLGNHYAVGTLFNFDKVVIVEPYWRLANDYGILKLTLVFNSFRDFLSIVFYDQGKRISHDDLNYLRALYGSLIGGVYIRSKDEFDYYKPLGIKIYTDIYKLDGIKKEDVDVVFVDADDWIASTFTVPFVREKAVLVYFSLEDMDEMEKVYRKFGSFGLLDFNAKAVNEFEKLKQLSNKIKGAKDEISGGSG